MNPAPEEMSEEEFDRIFGGFASGKETLSQAIANHKKATQAAPSGQAAGQKAVQAAKSNRQQQVATPSGSPADDAPVYEPPETESVQPELPPMPPPERKPLYEAVKENYRQGEYGVPGASRLATAGTTGLMSEALPIAGKAASAIGSGAKALGNELAFQAEPVMQDLGVPQLTDDLRNWYKNSYLSKDVRDVMGTR